ncbi:hypothetical protein QT611_12375 [Pseudomonas aeruginosa]|nr:hypothetical protein [Pseudomonas aeruginosa]
MRSSNRMRWPSRVNVRAAPAEGLGAQQRRLFDQRGSLDDRFALQRLTWRASSGDGSRGMSLDGANDQLQKLQANHAAMTEQGPTQLRGLADPQADWTNGAAGVRRPSRLG